MLGGILPPFNFLFHSPSNRVTSKKHTMTEFADYPYRWPLSESQKKAAVRAAALLKLENGGDAVAAGLNIIAKYAESHVKGKTTILFCAPRISNLIENNREFIEALCEEGVIEWLTPLVLTKLAKCDSIGS
jgi:hypothetical protein